jgi:hypothetical protein
MTCQRLSDRMALVLAGQPAWTEDERRHLDGCPDCAAEWNLLARAAAIGRAEPALDPEAISAKVVHRLATEPVVARRSTVAWWLAGGAIAAAAVLVVMLRTRDPGPGLNLQESAFEIPLVELDSLDPDQLRVVLQSIEEPLETPTLIEAPSMMELDDQQLERVLRSLEG